MHNSPVPSRQAASLVESADQPLPTGVVPPGTRPVVSVGAEPRHPGNAVLVEVRRADGAGQFLRVIPEAIQGQAQWFRTLLPPLEEGRRVDYRVELLRAGQLLASLPADGSWLTVRAEAAAPPVPAPVPEPPPPGPLWVPDWRHLATVNATLRPEIVGETAEGYRINFFVEDGRATGSGIDAVIRPGGGDRLCVRRDGVAVLDARMTWETVDGALVDYRSGGVLDLGPAGYARVAAGRLDRYPGFFATPTFMTGHPRWAWLNRIQGFGFGRVDMDRPGIRFDVHIPEMKDRPVGA